MTYLCVPILVTELGKSRRDIAAAAAAGADLVELRIDLLYDDEVLTILLRDRILPAIVTCRPTWEGGSSPLNDVERLAKLARAAEQGAGYIDVELKTAREHGPALPASLGGQSGEKRPRRIVSFHDFMGRPGDIADIVRQLDAVPADVNKIVWRGVTIRDNIDALKLLRHPGRPTIALCMGEAGIISRILAKKFGAFLSFASLNAESATAPGQILVGEMKNLYRWDAIGQATKVYGVVAHPVRHSMSPAIHNAAFTALGYDGVYVSMPVDPDYESFKAFMDDFLKFGELDLSGLSITIPHKENALRYLRETGGEIEELAGRIGAVNTLLVARTGNSPPKLIGRNTDYAAILDSITAAMNIDRTGLAKLPVAVLGAGGTGRSAVAALAQYGATVLIANRTPDKARALANEFNGRSSHVTAASIGDLAGANCKVIINTTSVGMWPNVDQTPFGNERPPFKSGMVVFDTIYNPMKTRLLTQAEGQDARTISGVEMFVRQAAAQFEGWTGRTAPLGVMRRVIEERLGLPAHSR